MINTGFNYTFNSNSLTINSVFTHRMPTEGIIFEGIYPVIEQRSPRIASGSFLIYKYYIIALRLQFGRLLVYKSFRLAKADFAHRSSRGFILLSS